VRIDFAGSARPTLGVEWELACVDAASGDLVPVAAEVLAAVRPEGEAAHPKVKGELLVNTVEAVTGICDTVAEAVEDLAGTVRSLRTVTDPLGVELFSAGCHPYARWEDQEVSEGDRYATLIDRTRWWGRQMVIFGVHVHVGVASADKVMPIVTSLLTWFPHLQALSASSPFWVGQDTGYASNRALLFQQLPTAGLPFHFSTWSEYEGYVRDLTRTGVIDGLPDIRWDVRPSPALGTVEVRVCDGLPTLREVAAVTALTQCLVVDLDRRLDDGETLPVMPPWHVQENKWRSARYGLDAEIILDAEGNERLVTDDLDDLLERLAPVARRLGCAAELADVAEIPRRGASYQRQRAVAERSGGDLRAVVQDLVGELREGTAAPAPAPAHWSGHGHPPA
jgi:glutamate---cysteine ligase / carboxylate-amine ligase